MFSSIQWQYPNHYLNAQPQSGLTFKNFQHPPKPQSGLKGQTCSFYLQNQYRKPKLGTQVYQRQRTIFIKIPNLNQGSKSSSQSQIRTKSLKGHECFLQILRKHKFMKYFPHKYRQYGYQKLSWSTLTTQINAKKARQ